MPKSYSNWKQQIKQEEVPPPPEAWEAISNELHPKKKARIIFFWTKVAVVLIPVLVGIGAWWWSKTPSYTHTQETPQKTDGVLTEKTAFQDSTEKLKNIKIASQNEEEFNNNQNYQIKENKGVTEKVSYVNSHGKEKKTTETLANTLSQKENNRFSSAVAKKEKSVEERITNIATLEQKINEYSSVPNPKAEEEPKEIVSLAPEEEQPKQEIVIPSKHKIYVSPYAGWVNLAATESMINEKLNDLKSKNTSSYSYGAKASYAVSPQWKITAGVGRMDFRRTTYDVPVTSTLMAGIERSNIHSISYLQIDLPGEEQYNSISPLNKETNIITSQEKSVSQEIRFVEIPLEVEYQITQGKKWNFSLATGVSTLLLSENRLYIDQEGTPTAFARLTDYNPVSFSLNGAVKAEYQLNQHLSLQVEPQIKYFLNSLREQNSLTPYIWGVSAGISFGF